MPGPEAIKSPVAGAPDGTRRLTWLYIIALSAVALLTLGGQWVVQWSLASQQRNSTVVNIAGRQRMLSQRLAKTALQVATAASNNEKRQLQQELDAIAADWRRAHEGLQYGDPTLMLPGRNSDAAKALYAELAPHYEAMLAGVRQITDPQADRDALAAGVQQILAHERRFVQTMDDLVFQYDREAQADITRLQRLERGLMLATLGVLLVEGLFIFRPAVAQIRATLANLRNTLAALSVAKAAAEEANREKSRFLARMSHELRTPLNAILGITELLLHHQRRETSSQHEPLRTVHDAAESLLRLVDDLLEVSRVEAGADLRLEPTPFSPRELVARTVRMFHQRAAQKQLRLAHDCGEDVPDFVLADAGRLQQILINLVNNAVKFTAQGEVRVSLKVVAHDAKTCRLRLAVRDTGPGIPAQEQTRIFESFTQLSQPGVARQEGVGLGLSIAARLATALGGRIDVESELGRGSLFLVEIPVQIGSTGPQLATPDHLPAHPALSILVVEDTPANQLVAREMLLALGHRPEMADDGAAALRAANERAFDVVLLDLELPDMTGLQLASQLRAIPGYAATPLVALTAHALAQQRAECVAAGFAGFLTKPVRLRLLAEELAGFASRTTSELTSTPPVHPDLSTFAERPELLRSLIRLFQEDWPRLMANIDAALAERDATQVRFFAHRLKGLISTFYDATSSNLAAQLESAAAESQLNGADAIRRSLFAALTELERQLFIHLPEPAPQSHP